MAGNRNYPLSRGISRRTLFRAGAAGVGLGVVGLSGAGIGHAKEPEPDEHHQLPAPLSRSTPGPLQNVVPFSSLNGATMMYMRWGGGDTQPRPHTFYCTSNFLTALQAWASRLASISAGAGYSGLGSIVSAGTYVSGASGQHGLGTAVDVDRIVWSNGTTSSMINLDWNSGTAALRKRYYAVDATLRAHFRWSLDRTYNAAHHDHIHSDFGGLPVILGTGSSSDVGWVQAACNEFMPDRTPLVVDRIWGPLTQGAFDASRSRLGVTSGNPHTTTSVYRAWLDGIAAAGFRGQNI